MQQSQSGSKLHNNSHETPFPPPRRNVLNVATLERRQLMSRTMRPDLKNYNLISPTNRPQPINMSQLQRSHEKLPAPTSNFNLQGVLRPQRNFKARNLKPLAKINHPLYSNPYKQKEMVEAQETFKELYGQLLSKMSRLQTLTKTFATDGPFHSLRQQTKHYQYLFALALGDPPLLSDPHSRDKFLKKTRKYSDLISKILSKVRIEIQRLSATHEMLKLLPRRSPSPNRPNDQPTTSSPRNLKSSLKLSSTSITQADISLSMRAKRSTSQRHAENDKTNMEDQIITPKPNKKASLQHSKFQSLPEIPCSPEVEPLIKSKEEIAADRKKSVGILPKIINRHQSNASKQSEKEEVKENQSKQDVLSMVVSDADDNKPEKQQKIAFTDEGPLQNPFFEIDPSSSLPEDAVSPQFNAPLEEQHQPELQVLNISNSEKEEEEQKDAREELSPVSDLDPLPLPQPSDFKLQLTRREALLFRKFLESMQLIEYFSESSDNTGVLFSFTDQGQGDRVCSQIQDYISSYRLSKRTMELAPSLFDDLQNDPHFMKILQTVSQVGTYEFD